MLHESLTKTTPNNLRLQLTSFVGRKQELAQVSYLLRDRTTPYRLLTLTGAGGSGKTRLASQVGASTLNDFEDGVWLVELASLSDPQLILTAIAQVLGLKEEAQRPLLDSLTEFLRPNRVLLILDNCEHLIEGCARFTEILLQNCPALFILATSREELRIDGEQVFRVPPLSLPANAEALTLEDLIQSEAGRLFVERAKAARSDFVLTGQNMAEVAQICQRLDGIPLALELAAARLKSLPLPQLATRLDDCLRLLSGGSRTALPRHQTLQALIDWSYNLLSEREQVLLRRLAGLVGSFSLEAAEFVCAGQYRARDGWGTIEPYEVLDLLLQLASKSLVQPEQTGPDIPEARYYLLETVRQYSREKLAEAGEVDTVSQKQLDWCLQLAEAAEPHLQGPEQVLWLHRLEREHNNLRAALGWALNSGENREKALRLCGALWRFWQMYSHFKEGWQWLKTALAQSETGSMPLEIRAKALHGAGVLLSMFDYATSLSLHEENLRLRQQLGDIPGQVEALRDLGWVALNQNDFKRAVTFGEESLKLNRELGDKRNIAASLTVLALAAFKQGETRRTALLSEECLQIWQELGDRGSIASAYNLLGKIAVQEGNYRQASELFLKSLSLNWEMGGAVALANALLQITTLVVAQKRQPEGLYLATHLLAAQEHMNQSLGFAMPPLARTDFESSLTAVRTRLDREIFEKLWIEGQNMNLEQAVTLAKHTLESWVEADEAAESLPSSSAPAIAQAALTDLTTREIEVLRLVATGLTNAQVAQELSVVPRTVNAHLTSIYAKIGVTSRSGAIRYALEHDLA